jgi:very-short-patch-repair endonuclease
LEDTLPAFLKGKQVVIAGDEHQMPPSNYFSKVFNGSVEDEDELVDEDEDRIPSRDELLLDCESLLDFADSLAFEKRYLDFHYRSRHPYLIDFSNHAFYNRRLKPLPANMDYIPIDFYQLDGTYSDQTNEAEADRVVEILEKKINRYPGGDYPSVGIATFNIAQRNLIKRKIAEKACAKGMDDFANKISRLEEGGLFVKNLENIQGDERDVIIISTTYGIGKDGRFRQSFGPINYAKGYKLLNVIITRAKFKVFVCTSIPEPIYMAYKDHLVTEGSNNRKAVFYAYLAYCRAVGEKNEEQRKIVLQDLSDNSAKANVLDPNLTSGLESPFEEEVYQVLAMKYGESKLLKQLQFAGFRIDIVFDPGSPDTPKLAIECDGAKYHSSREAYLYDLHRQRILEQHGFVFHRIWSTNWWRNSSREAQKLFNVIGELENKKVRPSSQHGFEKAFVSSH